MGRSRGLVFVGTQALIGEHIGFADLRLAVVDEQHRFGVAEREALSAKGGSVHVLLMTATPIPQVLGQVIHADLDVSDLRAAPVGRLPVHHGHQAPGCARGHLGQGASTEAARADGPSWSCRSSRPRVPMTRRRAARPGRRSSDRSRRASARPRSEAERLAALLAPLRVGMVHGRLKAADRDEVMGRFRDGDLDVLVGTTVVEVGVDVPAGHDDDHRERRPVRPGPAPPAARAGRPGHAPVVLRAGDRRRRRIPSR